MELTTSERRCVHLALALVALMVAGGLIYTLAGRAIAQAFVESGWAARIDASPAVDVTHWQHRLRAVIIRLTLAELAVVVLLGAYAFRRRDWILTRYFAEQDSPLQLAATRIIVFAIVLFVVWEAQPLNYVDLPGELTKAPFPFERVLRGVSFPGSFTTVVYGIFMTAVVCGLLGLGTRAAAAIAAITGVYVLGIPQSFGKVNHFHIAVWFPAVLAMSRAGDVLSLDAVWRARRAAHAGVALDYAPSRAYALPTRLIWLLLSMAYFFPGFYKIFGGPHDHVLEWAFSDSLRNAMSHQWYLKDIDPLFRLDHVPWLSQCAALAVVFWEFTWPLALMFPRLRVPLALSTILFHSMTKLMMGIAFTNLRLAMLLLFPWPRIARWVGSRIFGQPLNLIYDPQSPRQLAVANLLGAFNLFDQLRLVPRAASTPGDGELFGLHVDLPAAHAAARHAAVYRRLALPLPRGLGDMLLGAYVRRLPTGPVATLPPAAQGSLRPLVIVAATIASFNLMLAVLHMHRAWPFAIFPAFEVVTREHQLVDVQIALVSADGQETVFDRMHVRRVTRMSIWWEMTYRLLDRVSDSDRTQRVQGVWNFLCSHKLVNPDDYVAARFYRVKIDTLPENRHLPPVEKSLIEELSGDQLQCNAQPAPVDPWPAGDDPF